MARYYVNDNAHANGAMRYSQIAETLETLLLRKYCINTKEQNSIMEDLISSIDEPIRAC